MNNKSKYGFVILHYNVIEETQKSIESIKKNIGTENYAIIVVDNASPDRSGDKLKEIYEMDHKVIILQNSQNLGFAKGNNVGFLYAKNKLNVDFIVMMNNDVYVLDKEFDNMIEKEYRSSQFAVLGPKIITADGFENSNPFGDGNFSEKKIQSTIDYCNKKIRLARLHLLKLYDFYIKIKERCFPNKFKSNIEEYNSNEEAENVPLHGCCWVFSKKYIDIFDGLDDRTFLYGEEDILFLHCMKRKLKTVYAPQIRVFHNEHASTKNTIKSNKQQLFFYENLLNSTKILMDVYKG